MAKTKEILFKIKMNGRGIVNYDSQDQKFFLMKRCEYPVSLKNDNLKLGKKSFHQYVDENGEVKCTFNAKISSNCLRHSIFEKDAWIFNPKVTIDENILSYFISSFVGITRGYALLTKEKNSLVRASALTITSAEEVNGAVPYLEFCSSLTADGTTKKESEEKRTSLFAQETLGDVVYEAKGGINISQLQFMSGDVQFGRLSFLPTWAEGEAPLIAEMFRKHYGAVPFEIGRYTSTPQTYLEQFDEFGIKFEDEFVKYLITELLQRIGTLKITRANGFANVCSLECKAVTDGFSTFDNDGWVEIKTRGDIERFVSSLEIDDIYYKV